MLWQLRAKFLKNLRDFFDERHYLEVETPNLVKMPGTEVHLDYFESHWHDHKNDKHSLYLRSSPEISLKKVLSTGLPRVFEIAKCYRNGGEHSPWHQPEFTMLEFYEVGISYPDFINLTEKLVQEMADRLKGIKEAKDNKVRTFPTRFTRFTIEEAFKEFARIDLLDGDPELAKKPSHWESHPFEEMSALRTLFLKFLLTESSRCSRISPLSFYMIILRLKLR